MFKVAVLIQTPFFDYLDHYANSGFFDLGLLLGGVLIGLASAAWMHFNGKIADLRYLRGFLSPSLGHRMASHVRWDGFGGPCDGADFLRCLWILLDEA